MKTTLEHGKLEEKTEYELLVMLKEWKAQHPDKHCYLQVQGGLPFVATFGAIDLVSDSDYVEGYSYKLIRATYADELFFFRADHGEFDQCSLFFVYDNGQYTMTMEAQNHDLGLGDSREDVVYSEPRIIELKPHITEGTKVENRRKEHRPNTGK